ncbi:hypothetical protein [Burkholderia alba]|nr:hypothetical protein [Burkholderia alba]
MMKTVSRTAPRNVARRSTVASRVRAAIRSLRPTAFAFLADRALAG